MQPKIRVLVVSSKYPPEYAGSGLRAHNTYRRLHEKYGIKFEALAGSTAYFDTRHYGYEGVKVTRISSKLKRKAFHLRARGSKKLVRIWNWLFAADEIGQTGRWLFSNGRRFDLVHAYGNSWCVGIAIIWAKVTGRPIIRELVNHSASPHQPERLKLFLNWALKSRNAVIVAISRQLEIRCQHLGFTNIWHRPNPVDEEKFFVDRARKEHYRTKHSRFSLSDFVIVEISNYIPRKNKGFLLDVIAQLPPSFKLVIAGPLVEDNQPVYEEICRQVKGLGLEDRVQMETGFVEEVDEYIKMADVFAFPTLHEGLGTPMLEAIACGVPVVANKIEGVMDTWIVEGVNGFISSLDPVEFADKIRQALEIDAQTLNEASRRILAQAGSNVIDRAYYDLITSLVSRSLEGR
jgi:glycosyltransferase involved in cell wall biosynthesis